MNQCCDHFSLTTTFIIEPKNLSYTGGGKNGVYTICKKTEKIPCILWKIARNMPKIPDFLPYLILKILLTVKGDCSIIEKNYG